MNYEPLIEQLETWRDQLLNDVVSETIAPPARSVVALVVRGMNDVVTDLRRDSDGAAPGDVMRQHLATFGTSDVGVLALWAVLFRHEDDDAEDFVTISLHASVSGAKAEAERHARERGDCADFEWYLDTTGTTWLYSVAPDADVDCHCYMVERQAVRP